LKLRYARSEHGVSVRGSCNVVYDNFQRIDSKWRRPMFLAGFSAEASLYQTTGSYRIAALLGGNQLAGAQIVPSIPVHSWCTPCSGVYGWQVCCNPLTDPPCHRVRCTTRPPCWDPLCRATNCSQCYWNLEQGCCVKDCYPSGCKIGNPKCSCQQGCQPSECGM
jgi:hypothetical protein